MHVHKLNNDCIHSDLAIIMHNTHLLFIYYVYILPMNYYYYLN